MTFLKAIETAYRELGVPEDTLQAAVARANDALRAHPDFKLMETEIQEGVDRAVIERLKTVMRDPATRGPALAYGRALTAKWVAQN